VKPLEGTLVLDLTRNLPGPYCGMLLADAGAKVVKVEDRNGDPVRFLPPLDEDERSVPFRSLNAGKKSLAIDLKQPEGKELLRKLMAKADVLLDGFRPGVLDRLGCGHDQAAFPRLIYAALSGYGPVGPYRDRAGHDLNYQTFAGSVRESVPSFQVGDMTAAVAAFSGVLLALLERTKTGRGQRVETSMLRAAVCLQPLQLVPAARGETPEAALVLSGTVPCYRVYRTKDGRHVALAALEPKFWESFCEVVCRPAWLARHMDATLIPEVEILFASRAFDEWRMLEDSECCVSGALRWEEVAHDPQVEALGLFANDARGRPARLAPPFTLEADSRLATEAPSRPGEHTEEVLAEHLSLDRDSIHALAARGVIVV
jgi:crotonobetainyl-CoA:carnitine CoA-transferase CaiB-like acyl-CoA transferase